MTFRWRLGLAIVELAIVALGTWIATGVAFSASVWFISGVVGVLLALAFAEPFFTRPTDAIVSGVSVILICILADKAVLGLGWWIVLGYAGIGVIVGIVASIPGRDANEVGRATASRAYQAVRAFSAKVVYSAVFGVAIISEFDARPTQIAELAGTWALVLVISIVRWDRVFSVNTGKPSGFQCVGIVPPGRIVIASRSAPFVPGVAVRTTAGRVVATGHVVERVFREGAIAFEIQIDDWAIAETLVGKRLIIESIPDFPALVGIAGPNTSDDQIVFDSFTDLSIGDAVVLNSTSGRSKDVIHQVSELRLVIDTSFHGAHHEVTRVTARQLGELSPDGSINLTRDIAKPGDSIVSFSSARTASIARPTTDLLIGDLIGTNLPVWMDTSAIVQGHTAILGMTRMGKSTFALRLARHLSETYPVVVVDQTGEYRKLGLPLATPANATTAGLMLKDLETSPTPHKEALTALKALEALGRAEYAAGTTRQRVLILEEAHQFVPEPSMLGFNTPGREEAIQFGLLMMQVRKFGISVVLISQRTAVVAKSALSQCENVVAFKSVDQTGLDYLEAIGGRLAKELIPRMRQGEAVLMGPSFSGQASLAVKLAHDPPTLASMAPVGSVSSES